MTKKYTDEDICDILPGGRICDNCGKCLELEGVDIRAINIEDIAKTVEENEFIEKELQDALAALKEEANSVETEEEEEEETEFMNSSLLEEDYVDAFDNVVYFDEMGLDDDVSLEDLTEEVYPGIRKIKKY